MARPVINPSHNQQFLTKQLGVGPTQSSDLLHATKQHSKTLINLNFFFLGFLEKNRDSFSGDVREMITKSQNKYLIDLFKSELNIDTINKKNMTLSTKFRTSLDSLMRTLSMCHPFFIRCIKPNDDKVPNVSIYIDMELQYTLNICVMVIIKIIGGRG